MTLGIVVLIVLLLALAAVSPTWPHSAKWGFYPCGGLGIALVITLILTISGRY